MHVKLIRRFRELHEEKLRKLELFCVEKTESMLGYTLKNSYIKVDDQIISQFCFRQSQKK